MNNNAEVEITDGSLVPDELCTVTLTMSAALWSTIQSMNDFVPGTFKESRVPSLSLIAEALKKRCESCEGRGHQRDPVFEEHISPDTCSECGGSGRASVPGARMKPVGQHVEIR